MSRKIRIGIAGYGVVGKRRRHYIDLDPRLDVIGVCDRTFAEDGVFDDGIGFYTDYRTLLSQELDAVFVCMSNDIAPDVTIAGLENGLHVFCEKPPGRDIADIARVVECEKRATGLKLKYGFNHRYHNSIRDALSIVQSGDLGRVINLRGVYGKSKFISYGQHSDWRIDRKRAGGGILLDQGIHMVDLMRLFAGEFTDIHSFVSNNHWKHDVEDNAYALMRTADGKVAMLHSSATQWRHRFQLEVTLEKGTVIMSGILSGSKSYGAETLIIARTTGDDLGDPHEETRHYDDDPSWADEITEFTHSIINDEAVINGSSEDALKTMHLVYRIYCADQEWKQEWGLNDRLPNV